jgi:outer membrane lipoprotein SlyB
MYKIIVASLLAIFMTACASVSGYKPIINERADKFSDKAESDLQYCGELASKAAGYTTNGVEDALVAGSGAVITGAVSAGTGALAGAGIGSIVGLYYGLYEADETFKRAYNSCMSELGHPVVW